MCAADGLETQREWQKGAVALCGNELVIAVNYDYDPEDEATYQPPRVDWRTYVGTYPRLRWRTMLSADVGSNEGDGFRSSKYTQSAHTAKKLQPMMHERTERF